MIAQVLNTPSKSKKQIIADKVTNYFFDSLYVLEIFIQRPLMTRTLIHVPASTPEKFSLKLINTNRD